MTEATTRSIQFRQPNARDGLLLNTLIERCPPLDTNSVYCNLLQTSHFADTAVVAEDENNQLIGSITGYLLPNNPDTLFVWQVALAPEARGQGLALKMLSHLFERCEQAVNIETSISPDNIASQRLFDRFFEQLGFTVKKKTLFEKSLHFAGQHEDEVLYRATPPDHEHQIKQG